MTNEIPESAYLTDDELWRVCVTPNQISWAAAKKAYRFAKAEDREEIEAAEHRYLWWKAIADDRKTAMVERHKAIEERDAALAQVARLVEAAQVAIGHIENRAPHYVIKPLRAAIKEVQQEK